MPLSMLFWLIFVLWILLGAWANYTPPAFNWRPFGGHILLGILIFLLGWGVFGFVVTSGGVRH